MQDRFDRSVASQPDDPFAFACVMSELRFGMKYFVEQEGAEEVAAMEARLALKLNPPSGLREVEDVAIQETGDNCADDGHNATARLRDKADDHSQNMVNLRRYIAEARQRIVPMAIGDALISLS